MARLNGTLTVTLAQDVKSADGRRIYRMGETVSIAVKADADVRVWSGDRAPVIATYKELVGSTLPETANG